MARKKQPTDNAFVLFDVLYQDGARTSNRKVPSSLLGGLDGDEPAKSSSRNRTVRSPRCRAIRADRSRA